MKRSSRTILGVLLSARRFFCGCPSRLDKTPEGLARAGETATAGGLGEGARNDGEGWVLLYSCGRLCRESCPRFQALWQLLQQGGVQKNLPANADVESNLGNRNRDIADVNHLQAHPALAEVRKGEEIT